MTDRFVDGPQVFLSSTLSAAVHKSAPSLGAAICDAGNRPETEGTGNRSKVAPDRPARRKARALTSTSVPACAFPQTRRRTQWTVLTGRHSPALCSSPHRRAAAHLLPSPFACLPLDTNLPGLPSRGMVWSNRRSTPPSPWLPGARMLVCGTRPAIPSPTAEAQGDPTGPSLHALDAKSSSSGHVERV